MAKRQTSPRKPKAPKPTFGDALGRMRAEAHTGIRGAIDRALAGVAAPQRKGRQRPASGELAHALFDGIALAVAEEVVRAARPGCEVDMALLIGDAILVRVESLTAAGRC